jgi:hypothetical protein
LYNSSISCFMCSDHRLCGRRSCPGNEKIVFRRCSSEDCALGYGHGLFCAACMSGPMCKCGLDLEIVEPELV